MNKLVYIFLLVAQLALAQSQKYTVARVSGILTTQNGDSVFAGKSISLGEVLLFQGNAALVLMQGKQRYQVLLENSPLQLSKASLKTIPRNSLTKAKTRGSAALGINNLVDYFGDDKFAVIGEEIQVPIKTVEMGLSQEKVMVYRFVYFGDVIQKQIPSDSNKLLLQKQNILSHKAQTLDASQIKEPKLFYYDKTKKESKELVRFHLDFLEEESLQRDLKKLSQHSNEFKALKGEALLEELCVFFFDVYGKTDLNLLRIWLKKNIIDSK
jgi:hypothetical protein